MDRASLKPRTAFTLVELLVVVAIIGILVAVLLPSLQKAREQAKTLICQTNMRGLTAGAITYAAEFGRYPPSHASLRDLPANERGAGKDWLGVGGHLNAAYVPSTVGDKLSGVPAGFDFAPTLGLLWNYAKDEELYLCPKHRVIPIGTFTSYNSSIKAWVTDPGSENWKFSYTMFSSMGLRRPEDGMPPALTDATSSGPRGGGGGRKFYAKAPTAKIPFFVEEHPDGIGRFVNGHVEGTFNTGVDRVVARHGPYRKRLGRLPAELVGAAGSNLTTFNQGSTNISFEDGHVEKVDTSYGITPDDLKTDFSKGIPDKADGLLWYYHLQEQEIWAQPGGGIKYGEIDHPQ